MTKTKNRETQLAQDLLSNVKESDCLMVLVIDEKDGSVCIMDSKPEKEDRIFKWCLEKMWEEYYDIEFNVDDANRILREKVEAVIAQKEDEYHD